MSCSSHSMWKALGSPRLPWNANDTQLCCAFQTTTGVKSSAAISAPSHGPSVPNQRRYGRDVNRNRPTPTNTNTPTYFESSASPPAAPAASHGQSSSGGDLAKIGRATNQIESNANNISGPSGKTQLPMLSVNTGARLRVRAAQSPARSPKARAVSRNINQVEAANSAINGSRRITALSSPISFAQPPTSQMCSGG